MPRTSPAHTMSPPLQIDEHIVQAGCHCVDLIVLILFPVPSGESGTIKSRVLSRCAAWVLFPPKWHKSQTARVEDALLSEQVRQFTPNLGRMQNPGSHARRGLPVHQHLLRGTLPAFITAT